MIDVPFIQLKQAARSRLEGVVPKTYIDSVIVVELMGVALHLMNMRMKVTDAWVLLTGYDTPIIPFTNKKDILQRIRLYLFSYHSEERWKIACYQYDKVDARYCLLSSLKDPDFYFSTPQLYADRIDAYKNLLKSPYRPSKSKKKFLPGNEYTYSRKINGVTKVYSGEISIEKPEEHPQLVAYKSKKKIDLPSIEQLLPVAKEMDEVLGEHNGQWLSRLNSITVNRVNNSEKVHHVIGGLGAGKTSYRDVLAYYLAKEKDARILIIERKVTDVFQKAELFKKLKIHAVPITGMKRQKENFELLSESKEVRSIEDVEDNLAYTYLTGNCLIQSFAKDEGSNDSDSTFLPCTILQQKDTKKKYLCPLISYCGVYQALYELKDAQIWITTEASLLSMTLPATLDPYERTIYELAYDLTDIILIDEADQVKSSFENKFVGEVVLRTPEDFSEVQRLNMRNLEVNVGVLDDQFLSWRKNSSYLLENIDQLYQLIKENKQVRNLLTYRTVYLDRLVHRLINKIKKNQSKERMENELMKYIYKARHDSTENLSFLSRYANREDKLSNARKWLADYQVTFSNQKEELAWIDELLFFVYLANIQYAINYIWEHRYIAKDYNIAIDDLILGVRFEKFLPFIREPMTGLKYGFNYVEQEGKGQIKLIVYQGIGADLFYQWGQLYEAVSEKEGPAIVYFSGTSYAKDSPHYHLDKQVDILLSSKRQPPHLEQFCLELFDIHGDRLFVSGQPYQRREDVLVEMIHRGKTAILSELEYWKDRGEDRRILLVVNSYRDVEAVYRALENVDELSERFLVLDRDGKKEKAISPVELINLSQYEVDIFVAPLLSINRGYNILQRNSNRSLFGSLFFMARPYPTPNHLPYFIPYLHAMLPSFLNRIEKKGLIGVEGLRELRKHSNTVFRQFYQGDQTWTNLGDDEKSVLAWYTLIPIYQTIGRLMRGGTKARIFYVDAKFYHSFHGEKTMLEVWKELLLIDEDLFMKGLYGPFMESLKKIKKVSFNE